MLRRRRRRTREIAFGLDSFLDVIANVIGIIIRMILVVWVGARSYHAMQTPPPVEKLPPPTFVAPKVTDPLEAELARQRLLLQQAQEKMLEQLRQIPSAQDRQKSLQERLAALAAQRQELLTVGTTVTAQVIRGQDQAQSGALSLAELQQRSERLKKELAELQKQPLQAVKTLYYRTPVSKPVMSEEIFFECRRGRVSFIDIDSFMMEMRDDVKGRLEQLQNSRRIEGVTRTIGAFRLQYQVELAPSLFSTLPDVTGGWVVEPVADRRGETLEQALGRTSDFRRVVDYLDPRQAVVTFWVYPDSFALYRQLRDYLYRRDIEVAGRPLPEGTPIRASRDGTKSRGQ